MFPVLHLTLYVRVSKRHRTRAHSRLINKIRAHARISLSFISDRLKICSDPMSRVLPPGGVCDDCQSGSAWPCPAAQAGKMDERPLRSPPHWSKQSSGMDSLCHHNPHVCPHTCRFTERAAVGEHSGTLENIFLYKQIQSEVKIVGGHINGFW